MDSDDNVRNIAFAVLRFAKKHKNLVFSWRPTAERGKFTIMVINEEKMYYHESLIDASYLMIPEDSDMMICHPLEVEELLIAGIEERIHEKLLNVVIFK